jgi:hypothetical protein
VKIFPPLNFPRLFHHAHSHQSPQIHRTGKFLQSIVSTLHFLKPEQNFPALHHSSGLTDAISALILLPLLAAKKFQTPHSGVRTVNKPQEWNLYRTRFLVRARQLAEPLAILDASGREQLGHPGDYLVECSDGSRRIASRSIFEDIYVQIDTPVESRSFSVLGGMRQLDTDNHAPPQNVLFTRTG